jgi:hypothetical protein
VAVFDSLSVRVLKVFTPFGSFTGGTTVGVIDDNGDGRPDIVTGAGPGGGPQVTVFDGLNLGMLDSFFAFPGTFAGGVFVGGRA